MAIPSRNSAPASIRSAERTFFVTTSCWQHMSLLQSHAMARLLVDVLQHYRRTGKFRLHEFVIMPDHLHLLISVGSDLSIEKAVQFIKGGFSYRAKRELNFTREIWQRGFSDSRVYSASQFLSTKTYIHENPVRAGLVQNPRDWEYSSANSKFETDRCPTWLSG